MKPANILYAIIIFGLVTSGIWMFVADLGNNYDITVDEEYMDEYNKIDTLRAEVVEPMRTEVKESNSADSTDGSTFRLSSGLYAASKYILNIPTFTASILNSIASELGIPPLFVGGLIVMIIIATIFALLRIIGVNLGG